MNKVTYDFWYDRLSTWGALVAVLVCIGVGAVLMVKKDSNRPKADDSPKPVKGSVVLKSVSQNPEKFYINFSYTDMSSWPQEKQKDGRYFHGWIKVNGERVEHFRPGYAKQHLENVYGGEPYKVPGIKKGDTVLIQLESLDGKGLTNPVKFVWPWENT